MSSVRLGQRHHAWVWDRVSHLGKGIRYERLALHPVTAGKLTTYVVRAVSSAEEQFNDGGYDADWLGYLANQQHSAVHSGSNVPARDHSDTASAATGAVVVSNHAQTLEKPALRRDQL